MMQIEHRPNHLVWYLKIHILLLYGDKRDNICHDKAWFAMYMAVFVSFYIFTSPFVTNPELIERWTPYVYISMTLHFWLLSAVVCHIPMMRLGLLDYDVKEPVYRIHTLEINPMVIIVLINLV